MFLDGAFASVVVEAQHLAVGCVRLATLRPWGGVVCLHLADLEMLAAPRADSVLSFVCLAPLAFGEIADGQVLLVAAKDIGIDTFLPGNVVDQKRRLVSWRIAVPERVARLNRLVTGWCAYFSLAETPSTFEEADKWLRRRLRQVRWKEWKRPQARFRNLLAMGIPRQKAYEWANSSAGH